MPPDQRGREVDLVPLQAVAGRARERVVVVVPRLAERREREPEDVRRLVLDLEAAAPEEVADGVDRPGHVVLQEDADEAAPEQTGQQRLHREAAEHEADERGDREAEQDPPVEAAVDPAHPAVLDELLGVLAALGLAVVGEQPAHVRVEQALERAHPALAELDVGRVRVALLVGVRVVLAVVGDPVDDRALHRHRPGDREAVLDRLEGLERAMREEPVEPDGHAEAGDEVHDGERDEVADADVAVPEQDDRREERDERQDDGDQVDGAFGLGHGL